LESIPACPAKEQAIWIDIGSNLNRTSSYCWLALPFSKTDAFRSPPACSATSLPCFCLTRVCRPGRRCDPSQQLVLST
jgi:hypothetical protein